jgi:hypothetical protein
MMEKLAQLNEGGGRTPNPFVTYKVAVYAPAKRADTLPLFLLYTVKKGSRVSRLQPGCH